MYKLKKKKSKTKSKLWEKCTLKTGKPPLNFIQSVSKLLCLFLSPKFKAKNLNIHFLIKPSVSVPIVDH